MAVVRNLAILFIACLPAPGLAFDRCTAILAEPATLADFISERGVYDGPVRYFEAARAIRVETGAAPGGLIPHAGRDAEGRPVIYYPIAFVPPLCRIAVATFIVLDGDNWRPFAVAARDAAVCADTDTPFDLCLVQFSLDLETGYRDDYAALDAASQALAYRIFQDAAAQIGVHEYAHHLLDHRQRIADRSLARIDAEFEADFHAILNGVQIGESPGAMYYFFKALADIESYAGALGSQDYESGACRATNVNDITAAMGIAPIALLDAVDGGGRLTSGSPEFLQETAGRLRGDPPPAPSEDACGRISATMLSAAHEELADLLSVAADYGGILYADDTRTAEGLGLDDPAAFELLGRLVAAAAGLEQLDGLAAQAASRLIQRVEFAGAERATAADLDRLLATGSPGLIARDYGRLLKVAGLLALYDPAQPFEARLPEARQSFEASVSYAPGQSESWMNLAYIALAEARCARAAELAGQAALTAGGEEERESAEGMRAIIEAAVAGGSCEAEAASMARILAE